MAVRGRVVVVVCAKGASERFLCQHDGLGWLERELVQRCKEM